MQNSKIKEHLINANISRLKIISLISLGFSVFVLLTDFLVDGIWQAGFALITTLNFHGDFNDNSLSLIFLLIPYIETHR